MIKLEEEESKEKEKYIYDFYFDRSLLSSILTKGKNQLAGYKEFNRLFDLQPFTSSNIFDLA
mgnify:CR=1 FL=1